jgi:hypothetical protein
MTIVLEQRVHNMGYDLDTPFLEKKPLGVEQVALEDSRDQK